MPQTTTAYVRLSPRIEQMLTEIKNKSGALNNSEIIRQAISEMYERITTGRRPDASKAFMPGRPKGANKEEQKRQDQIGICVRLDGELCQDGNACKYSIYELTTPNNVEKFEQEIPLSYLTESYIEKQYKPDRSTCEKIMYKKK